MRSARGVWLLPLGAFLLSCAVSAISFHRRFEGGVTQEFCDHAAIGRNVAEGKGLRTALLTPQALAYLDSRGIPFDGLAPVVDRYPLQAWPTALLMLALGADDVAPALLSLLLLAACAAAACAVGLLVFGAAEGALAGLLFALNPSLQSGYLLSGQPDLGFCLLTLLAAALAWHAASPAAGGGAGRQPRWGLFAAAGVLAGLAASQRASFILWLPLFAWWLGRGPGGRRGLGLFAAGMAAASLPALAYDLSWFGTAAPPTAAWSLSEHVVVLPPSRLSYRIVEPWALLVEHLPSVGRKLTRYLYMHLRALPSWWRMQLIFPAVLWGCWTMADGPPRAFARRMLAMLAVQLVAFSLLRYEGSAAPGGHCFLWFAPAAFLVAARAAVDATRDHRWPWAGPVAFGALNAAYFLWVFWSSPVPRSHPKGWPAGSWPEIAAAAEAAGPNGLIATNLPGQVVWYGRRPAVALPARPEDLLKIARRHPVAAVLISRLPAGRPKDIPGWEPFMRDRKEAEAYCRAAGFDRIRGFGASLLLDRKAR